MTGTDERIAHRATAFARYEDFHSSTCSTAAICTAVTRYLWRDSGFAFGGLTEFHGLCECHLDSPVGTATRLVRYSEFAALVLLYTRINTVNALSKK